MKPLRLFYLVVLVVSAGLAYIFHYQYQLKNEELAEIQKLNRYSEEALKQINAQFAQNKKELDSTLQEVDKLNEIIAALEKEKSSAKVELEALETEKDKLEKKLTQLIDEKAALEEKYVSLEQRFHSLEELKKAIRIAKIEELQKSNAQIRQRLLAKIAQLETLDELALRQGNRGFLVKAGKTTFKPTRIRVELEPITEFSNNRE